MLSKVLSIIALTAALVLIINIIGLIIGLSIHLACLWGNIDMEFPITLLTWLTVEFIAFTILFTTLFIAAIAD